MDLSVFRVRHHLFHTLQYERAADHLKTSITNSIALYDDGLGPPVPAYMFRIYSSHFDLEAI